KRQTLL
ncbi:methyl-accepting chemotaxis (MCP) signaling domain protein, partial [Vibrio parahaemolyticus V-223/04]